MGTGLSRIDKRMIVPCLIVAATLIKFGLVDISSAKIDRAKDLLLESSIDLSTAVSSHAANTAEILLDSSIKEMCELEDIVDNGGCGSNNILLKDAWYIRDAIRVGITQSQTQLQIASGNYSEARDQYMVQIRVGNILFLILQIAALTTSVILLRTPA